MDAWSKKEEYSLPSVALSKTNNRHNPLCTETLSGEDRQLYRSNSTTTDQTQPPTPPKTQPTPPFTPNNHPQPELNHPSAAVTHPYFRWTVFLTPRMPSCTLSHSPSQAEADVLWVVQPRWLSADQPPLHNSLRGFFNSCLGDNLEHHPNLQQLEPSVSSGGERLPTSKPLQAKLSGNDV